MEPAAECILVIIGATPEGKKELLGFHVGTRESSQSWRELLVDLKARGLARQDALRELLSRRPDYSLSGARDDLCHFADTSFVELYIEGLRRAGLDHAQRHS